MQKISKRWQKMIEKHGSEEAAKEYMRSLGRKGGEKRTPDKGFGSLSMYNRKKHIEISSKGGKIKAKNNNVDKE